MSSQDYIKQSAAVALAGSKTASTQSVGPARRSFLRAAASVCALGIAVLLIPTEPAQAQASAVAARRSREIDRTATRPAARLAGCGRAEAGRRMARTARRHSASRGGTVPAASAPSSASSNFRF